MSYCRNDGVESDVYVIRTFDDRLICYCCLANNEADRPEEMITHLLIHRSIGHRVPQRALDRLNAERFGLPYKTDVEQALDEIRAMDPRDWAATRPAEPPL